MTWLALDIGGANLKAADGLGWAQSVPFMLWRDLDDLGALAGILAAAPAHKRLAVTMTGELCDCFRTKTEGVRRILAAVELVADSRAVCVYLVNGRLASLDEARELPDLAAASNWHALAQFACRFVQQTSGLLIDVGSTTTDVIPLTASRPAARGTNDTERLLAGELVYTGVGRTPIFAVTRVLPWRGCECPVAAEHFATTADAYVVLAQLAEQPAAAWTADGRPLTTAFARERLARMICADATTFDDSDAQLAAEFVSETQLSQVRTAMLQVCQVRALPPECFVISGAGEFLARRLVLGFVPNGRIISLAEHFGAEASECAPAHALAVLAAETEAE